MTELEKIEYAKSFIDKLANGINPLDDSLIPDNDIANNVRLSRCFFYVSDILRQVIENGGVQPAKVTKQRKNEFALSDGEREKIQISETPLTVSEISNHLNNLVDLETTKKISAANPNKPGPKNLPVRGEVKVEHLKNLKDQMEHILLKWQQDTRLGGALVSVHYKDVVAKLNIKVVEK